MDWVKRGEGVKKYKLIVIKQSQGCKVQCRKYSQQYCDNYVRARWVIEILGDNIIKCMIIQTPHCTHKLKQNNIECKL